MNLESWKNQSEPLKGPGKELVRKILLFVKKDTNPVITVVYLTGVSQWS